MTIEQSKEKLKKDGYTWFELSDFDNEFYNWLLPVKCDENHNIKNQITYLRVNAKETDGPKEILNISMHDDFDSFENAAKKKEELLNLFKENKKINCSQMWFYNDFAEIITKNEEIDLFKKYIDKIVRYYFDFEETQEFSLFSPSFTYYDNNCHLENHSDGTGTGRVCALLIYLNDTYDEKHGGILVLNNNERVLPIFGKVAIIDLQTFDIPHMVTEVTGGIGRYALLTFVKKKEDELIHTKYEMKELI